jgi:hypothetical protein
MKIFDPNKIKPGESLSGVIFKCDLCGRRGRWSISWSRFCGIDDSFPETLFSCGCRVPDETEAEILRRRKIKSGGRNVRSARKGC